MRFKNILARKLSKTPSMRRISVGAWDHPKDPTIYARIEIPFSSCPISTILFFSSNIFLFSHPSKAES